MSFAPAIEIKDLCVTFGGKTILDHFSLTVPYSGSLVLIGPSGAGKSILLRCILGLTQPVSGTIKINGELINTRNNREKKKIQGKIGMLFQNAALFDSLTVLENVIFGLKARHAIRPSQARAKAAGLLGQVGLGDDILDLYPADLSGGMQKRVGLARTIATSPEIILFDEPTTGLDPIMSTVINRLIAHISQSAKRATLTITHDMRSAATIAERVAMLFNGKIIWEGPSEELLTTQNPYVSQFVHGKIDGPVSQRDEETAQSPL